jgi:2-methylcitrate dehydratase PrpD
MRKLTRRELAAALTSAAVPSAALAQTPPGALPTPAAELQEAQDQVKANVAALLQMEVPMSTEPAFQFKA